MKYDELLREPTFWTKAGFNSLFMPSLIPTAVKAWYRSKQASDRLLDRLADDETAQNAFAAWRLMPIQHQGVTIWATAVRLPDEIVRQTPPESLAATAESYMAKQMYEVLGLADELGLIDDLVIDARQSSKSSQYCILQLEPAQFNVWHAYRWPAAGQLLLLLSLLLASIVF